VFERWVRELLVTSVDRGRKRHARKRWFIRLGVGVLTTVIVLEGGRGGS
jgi:hypothetical protein